VGKPRCSRIARTPGAPFTDDIRFDLNDYSIPHELVHKPLTLVASNSIVCILDGDREVARHVRSYDRGEHVQDLAHIDALVQQKWHAHERHGRDRLRQACPHADAFIGTNLAFSDWLTIFPNATCATALIDHVVHHADIISIEGESYRLREAKETAARRGGVPATRKKR